MKRLKRNAGIKLYSIAAIILLAIVFVTNGSRVDGVFTLFSTNFLHWPILGSKIFRVKELFELFGGLGLFLFGIKFMGEGLQLSAGNKIKYYITKFTSNPIKGFMLGVIVTGLIQSSSGTTALVVALVSVGLMTFRQSIAVIIGSNVGTTVTSILIGLSIKDYVWMIITIGGLMYMFSKQKKTRYIAQTILGFGILFLGMKYMGEAMKPLAQEPWFKGLIIQMDSGRWYSSWLGLIVSMLLTVLVQSSSASIGIIHALHADSLISGAAVIPMIFGANIGTTVTALLAAISTSLYAKRTALFHAFFNITGAILFTSLIFLFKPFISFILRGDLTSSALIPTTHVIFNLIMAIIFIPMIPFIDKMICKVMPQKNSDDIGVNTINLNESLIESTPILAVKNAQNALAILVKLVNIQTDSVYKLFKHGEKKEANKVEDISLAINQYTNDIVVFLEKISSKEVPISCQETITHLTLITRDIIRISELNSKLKEIASDMKSGKQKFCEEAYQEMKVLFKLVIQVGVDLSTLLSEGYTSEVYDSLISKENKINKIEANFKRNQVERIKRKKASTGARSFNEVLTRIERISDHYKIAAEFLNPKSIIIDDVDHKLIKELVDSID